MIYLCSLSLPFCHTYSIKLCKRTAQMYVVRLVLIISDIQNTGNPIVGSGLLKWLLGDFMQLICTIPTYWLLVLTAQHFRASEVTIIMMYRHDGGLREAYKLRHQIGFSYELTLLFIKQVGLFSQVSEAVKDDSKTLLNGAKFIVCLVCLLKVAILNNCTRKTLGDLQ